MEYTNNTQLVTAFMDGFKTMVSDIVLEVLNTQSQTNPDQKKGSEVTSTPTTGKNYVYGLKGIMRLFGVSNVTAQRYKNGIIAPAVYQHGKKIVVDADMALELFNNHKNLTA